MKYEPTELDAVVSLVGGGVSCGRNSGGEIEYYFHDGQKAPTQEKIDAELKVLQDKWDSEEYARTRQTSYPPIGDQLDALYHAGAFPTDMAAKIKKVKDDNPKK